MTRTTTFRVTDAESEAVAERNIRRLTRQLQLPSVREAQHLAGRYETERDQWQQAIEDAKSQSTTHSNGASR